MRSEASRIRLERTFAVEVADLWELWTTKDGFESWWGPEGFRTDVRKLELEVGGQIVYSMTAIGSEQIEFLRKSGTPLVTENRMTLTEMVPMQRLAYSQVIDFLPGVPPYHAALEVDFSTVPEGARMTITMDVMHDEEMTRLAVMGMESQLGRLEARFRRT